MFAQTVCSPVFESYSTVCTVLNTCYLRYLVIMMHGIIHIAPFFCTFAAHNIRR